MTDEHDSAPEPWAVRATTVIYRRRDQGDQGDRRVKRTGHLASSFASRSLRLDLGQGRS
jgi:hypothetical protein